MKTKTLSLSLAALAALPGMAFAQGTYLSAPDGNPTNALIVANGGNVGVGRYDGTPVSGPTALLEVYGTIRHFRSARIPACPVVEHFTSAVQEIATTRLGSSCIQSR